LALMASAMFAYKTCSPDVTEIPSLVTTNTVVNMFTLCSNITRIIILPDSPVTCVAILCAVTACVLHSVACLVAALFTEGIS
jgi:hypothetical protein